MITQKWKDFWYRVWSPVLQLNLCKHKILSSHTSVDTKINIGCGKSKFQGWINIDGNILHHPDMWLDVRYGLPFRSESIKVIYACHFFEHFYLDKLRYIFIECRRVLRSDGGMRVVVPNLRSSIEAYQQGSMEWFSNFPIHFRTVGGRFVNEMLCGDQHRMMFDFEFLSELFIDAGFRIAYERQRGESQLLEKGDQILMHELRSGGKIPDPWLLVEALL